MQFKIFNINGLSCVLSCDLSCNLSCGQSRHITHLKQEIVSHPDQITCVQEVSFNGTYCITEDTVLNWMNNCYADVKGLYPFGAQTSNGNRGGSIWMRQAGWSNNNNRNNPVICNPGNTFNGVILGLNWQFIEMIYPSSWTDDNKITDKKKALGVRSSPWVKLQHVISGQTVLVCSFHGNGGASNHKRQKYLESLCTDAMTYRHKANHIVIAGDFNMKPDEMFSQPVQNIIRKARLYVHGDRKFITHLDRNTTPGDLMRLDWCLSTFSHMTEVMESRDLNDPKTSDHLWCSFSV